MYENLGKLTLRVALGVMILLHGISKLINGIDPISGLVVGAGLPAVLAYGVYIGEVLAPAAVIAGWYSRLGAILIAINMLFAIGLVHASELFARGTSGGWALETQGLFLVAAVTVALIGPGRYAVNNK